ncbi:MAG: cardiolipin synthase [Bacilli bacterium]|nr:cardiolipin synthase [Bacilli bacterium]
MNKSIKKLSKKNKSLSYIPIRYILAILLTLLETAIIVAIVILLTIYIPYFYIAVLLTQLGVVLAIFSSDDNPDYKLPWLLFVLILPVAGFMLYFLFYRRKLSKKYIKKLKWSKNLEIIENNKAKEKLRQEEDSLTYSSIKQLCTISNSHVYMNTKIEYFKLGDLVLPRMLEDLEKAEKFIFIEYFIISEGYFWNEILNIILKKVNEGVDVKVIYDDIGCMMTLPGNYCNNLRRLGIDCVIFSPLRGQADSEFNNRSHRKIMSIDNKVAYTGGINIADEYINKIVKHGKWKDVAIRLEGDAVSEMTKLFIMDYNLNSKKIIVHSERLLQSHKSQNDGYVVPFGDGPFPIYKRRVGKSVIMNMLNQAKNYVYITSPYLIIDDELTQTIENCALRGIDVRIVTPHVPDKKIILSMTRSSYKRLIESGVKIYEYKPGFIHSKVYLSDDSIAMVGTINLDYRSLVHHFENGVYMYKCSVIQSIKKDLLDTMDQSIFINEHLLYENILTKILRSFVKVFSSLL